MDKLIFHTKTKIYSLDPIHVAKHRADYYEPDDPKENKDEIDFALEDDYALHDWLFNNTDPDDFLDKFEYIGDIEDIGISKDTRWDDLELQE